MASQADHSDLAAQATDGCLLVTQVPTTAPLPPLGAATAAAVAVISKAAAMTGNSLGTVAVAISTAISEKPVLPAAVPVVLSVPDKTTGTPSKTAKQPGSKSSAAKPDSSKAAHQNGHRITTRCRS